MHMAVALVQGYNGYVPSHSAGWFVGRSTVGTGNTWALNCIMYLTRQHKNACYRKRFGTLYTCTNAISCEASMARTPVARPLCTGQTCSCLHGKVQIRYWYSIVFSGYLVNACCVYLLGAPRCCNPNEHIQHDYIYGIRYRKTFVWAHNRHESSEFGIFPFTLLL